MQIVRVYNGVSLVFVRIYNDLDEASCLMAYYKSIGCRVTVNAAPTKVW